MDNTNIETVPSNGRHRPSKVIHNAYVIEPYGIEPHQEGKLVMNVKSVVAQQPSHFGPTQFVRTSNICVGNDF